MRVVQHLDEGLWRAFVDNNPRANIFHTPEMFRVFAHSKGHTPALWATLGTDGQVLALLLAVQIAVLNGPFRHLTTRAVAYGSALSASGPQGQEALATLLRTYNHELKGRLLFTELRNLSDLSDLQPVLQQSGFAYEEHLNFLVDLTRPRAELWNGIRSNARRNIQKARKSGVKISEIDDPHDLPAAYALLRRVYRRIQVPLPDRSLLRSAFDELHPSGRLRILLAKIDGVSIGVLTLLSHRDTIHYWYTGTLREYATYRSADLLVWHALELGSELCFRTFDFGGGGKPDEKYGVRDFKAKFGGNLVSYGRNTCVHAPLRLRLSSVGYRLLRRFL